MATITSADNASRIEFTPNGDFLLAVNGGTTINAEIQYKTTEGNWEKIIDADGLSDIAADYDQLIKAAPNRIYGIYVTTATGTWDYAWSPLQK